MNDIIKAAQALKSGDVVAIPTETVYGLAGSILSEKGLKKIFSIKERPFFDPLIVHVSSIDSAKSLTTSWDSTCEALSAAFWPGPLTLVLKKNEKVSDLITAGLDSVGIRFPSHPVAQKVIEACEAPLAAPSANKFMRTSPTTKDHVLEEFGGGVMVLEGGQSEIGIESTVVGVFPDKILIYRPGMISKDDIENALRKKGLSIEVELAPSPVAPGQLKHHYMPKIPVVLNWDRPEGLELPCGRPSIWRPTDPVQTARELYGFFRQAEKEEKDSIVIELKSELKNDSRWAGILNRLDKAKSSETFY